MTSEIISPSEIYIKLLHIWDSSEWKDKTRASLFNLIFYTKKNARTEYIYQISQKVVEKFPSRLFFIFEEEKGEYLNAKVSVFYSSKQENATACDSIQLDVAGDFKQRVPFIILPHILPDLPIYVIWEEDPSKSDFLFEELKKLATRMIFDSESIEDFSVFAKKLLQLDKDKLDIADLNWARLESWRELLASTFYTKERLELLKKSTKLQILYNAKETAFTCHTQIQAIYLQGWLSTQLGWKLNKLSKYNGKWTFQYTKKGGTVEINLHPDNVKNFKAGSILSIDIETEDKNTFSFGCNLDLPNHVSMRFSTLEKCDIPLKYIFGKEESGQSLVKEICHQGTSKHFLNLLKYLATQKEFSIEC